MGNNQFSLNEQNLKKKNSENSSDDNGVRDEPARFWDVTFM